MTLQRPCFVLPTLVLALGLSGCAAPPSSGQLEKEEAEQAKTLWVISEALKANMAVVLVADLTPHKSLADADGMSKWTPNVVWTHEDKPEIVFGRKFQNNALQRDPKTTYLFKAFEVHVLPPGKYLMTGGDDYRLNAQLDQLGAKAGATGSGRGTLGTATLSPETYRQFYTEMNWKEGSTHSQSRIEKYCTTVHRASGNCVAWGERMVTDSTPGMAAGYYQDTDSRDIPALKVQVRVPPRQALASFTLEGGELVLSQRSHLKTPSYQFRQAGCRKVAAEKVECPLEDFTVHTLPPPMEFTRNYLATRANLNAEQEKLMARLVPMQVTTLGRQGAADPVWGTPISLRKGP